MTTTPSSVTWTSVVFVCYEALKRMRERNVTTLDSLTSIPDRFFKTCQCIFGICSGGLEFLELRCWLKNFHTISEKGCRTGTATVITNAKKDREGRVRGKKLVGKSQMTISEGITYTSMSPTICPAGVSTSARRALRTGAHREAFSEQPWDQ